MAGVARERNTASFGTVWHNNSSIQIQIHSRQHTELPVLTVGADLQEHLVALLRRVRAEWSDSSGGGGRGAGCRSTRRRAENVAAGQKGRGHLSRSRRITTACRVAPPTRAAQVLEAHELLAQVCEHHSALLFRAPALAIHTDLNDD